LILSVTDDGLGLRSVPVASHRGSRTALANIRERLAEVWGGAAHLAVEAHRPHGVCATLVLPAA
jgi:LytS/YehU family sensor histidine kinase